MKNIILNSITFLVALAAKAVPALAQHSATLNLPHSVSVDLEGRLNDLEPANTAYTEALLAMKNKRIQLANAVDSVRGFMMLVRQNLRPVLGKKYSTQWTAVGFSGSLRVPSTADDLLNAMQLMQGYLAAHPIPDGGATLAAARAGVLRTTLSNALAAVAQQKEVVSQTLLVRDQKAKTLEAGLRTLLSELHQVLDPMDARWFAFGFLKPGQKQAPERPGKIAVTMVNNSVAMLKWSKAARAEYYRLWKKVVGVDEDYVSLGNTSELNFTLPGLQPGSQVEVVISSVNNGGESLFSDAAILQIP